VGERGRKDENQRNGVAQAVTSGKGDGSQKTENLWLSSDVQNTCATHIQTTGSV